MLLDSTGGPQYGSKASWIDGFSKAEFSVANNPILVAIKFVFYVLYDQVILRGFLRYKRRMSKGVVEMA